MKTIGILLFDDVEELDFVGPYEVFTVMGEILKRQGREPTHDVLLLAENEGAVRCAKGMQIIPHARIDTISALDVLLVPGGRGTRGEVKNAALLAWIGKAASGCTWVTSVCTGALLLTAAGLARGKRVTTHWGFVQALRERGEAAEVLEDVRYVRDGNIVTAAGVSAGIDMALWLVGQIHTPALARLVRRMMEYDPAPPYAADV